MGIGSLHFIAGALTALMIQQAVSGVSSPWGLLIVPIALALGAAVAIEHDKP